MWESRYQESVEAYFNLPSLPSPPGRQMYSEGRKPWDYAIQKFLSPKRATPPITPKGFASYGNVDLLTRLLKACLDA
jgi:hypothetical protein